MLLTVGCLVVLALSVCDVKATSSGKEPPGKAIMDGSWDDGWLAVSQIHGTAPLSGLRHQTPGIIARDCLSNGTNYCFGDSVNYCLGCGVCCQGSTNSKWCCSLGSTCCGSQCCAEGQTCSNGQCYLPVVSVTRTSSLFVTVSHGQTLVATVFEDVVQTSTINVIIETTISSLATQTDVQWVTTTISNAKREDPLQGAVALREASVFDRRTPGAPDHVYPRQETQTTQSATASTTTVLNYITRTIDTTSVLYSTTTQSATSTVLTTLYQTATRVLNAETTVSITSTWTVRPPKPTTITKTEFATLPAEPQATTQSSASSTRTPGLAIPTGKSSHKDGPVLSTPAIAGIAAGASIALLVLAGLAIFICLKRRRRRQQAAAHIEDDVNAYYGIMPGMTALGREPLGNKIFASSTSPGHHRRGAPVQPVAGAGAGAGQHKNHEHERTASSHTAGTATTLVGSASSPTPAQDTGTGSRPAEVAGTEVPPRYEVEGSSPPLNTPDSNESNSGSWGGAHRRNGSEVIGRRRRSDGGNFAINF